VALAYRQRIFAWLVAIAVVPAVIAITVSLLAPRYGAPVGGARAWEDAAASWRELRGGIRAERLSPEARLALERHGEQLSISVRRARQAEAIRAAFSGVLAAAALALAVLVLGGAVRLAGHLSRQLSRPIDELVAWTRRIQRGEPLPDAPPAKGAPEFTVLRDALRTMAGALERARSREVEAAELRAFRELAGQVAHELKNPLTPMRFAIQRLAREAPESQRELIGVLETESRRLEQMARDFGELGRLPEGPAAPVDLAELCDELAKGGPDGIRVRVDRLDVTPRVAGHYEPLRRAFHNLVINAIDAVKERGEQDASENPEAEVVLGVRRAANGGEPAVEVTVRDTGVGIPAENLARVFEPHFTTKSHGTGLGLAIARQTVHHHGGSITIASERGRGTTVTVILPCGTA
jgi:two-component system nitrogen regulation sensor histidine kinase NtrY